MCRHCEAERAQQDPDPVSAPHHYTHKSMEKDAIAAVMVEGLSGMEASYVADAIKYIYRAGVKDPAKKRQDIEKAVQRLKSWAESVTE